MLVMIDAIDQDVQRLRPDLDVQAAWQRLTRAKSPAVSFYLLPLDDMESDEDLYIKMNSRGKPLTPFENFKARFEQDIQHSNRADEFAHKIDGPWSDLLWPYHGGDNIIDDELIRYIGFITKLCELREGKLVREPRLGPRARAIFGRENERASEHLDFLFGAFDSWQDGEHISDTFNEVLRRRSRASAAMTRRKSSSSAPPASTCSSSAFDVATSTALSRCSRPCSCTRSCCASSRAPTSSRADYASCGISSRPPKTEYVAPACRL
ncbi:hypothetical protein [Amycolatopsis taiwanensis]|nr:hypothetical protein [Amycolatopsis taiwanensis]